MGTIDYMKILETAIGNEIEAYEFYANAAKKSNDINLKAIFNELAEEEMKHKLQLEAFLKNESKQMNFHAGADYKVSESVELPKLTADMSFADGVALAMKKEEEAMVMYQQFANASVDANQKNIFQQLAIMEQGHKIKLEGLYTNTAYIEAW
jgi:rubrerythrin